MSKLQIISMVLFDISLGLIIYYLYSRIVFQQKMLALYKEAVKDEQRTYQEQIIYFKAQEESHKKLLDLKDEHQEIQNKLIEEGKID